MDLDPGTHFSSPFLFNLRTSNMQLTRQIQPTFCSEFNQEEVVSNTPPSMRALDVNELKEVSGGMNMPVNSGGPSGAPGGVTGGGPGEGSRGKV
jgi:hypothetical protein